MQSLTREMLIEKASKLIADGTVNRVLGWKNGDFCYDITPAIFENEQEMQKDFVFGDFCGANFSKYLVKETKKDGKVLVFLKPCDTYSFNQLLTEHRFDREKVYAVGIPCDGMVDVNNIKEIVAAALFSTPELGLLNTHFSQVQAGHTSRQALQRIQRESSFCQKANLSSADILSMRATSSKRLLSITSPSSPKSSS